MVKYIQEKLLMLHRSYNWSNNRPRIARGGHMLFLARGRNIFLRCLFIDSSGM